MHSTDGGNTAFGNSRLIVIDTLQKIRTTSKDNAYANDYGDISLLKDFADRHSLSVAVVHHIRKDYCHRREADQSYVDKLFIPVQGCLLEVVREQYADFYKGKERWRYLKKLDTNHSLLSLKGFTDGEGRETGRRRC